MQVAEIGAQHIVLAALLFAAVAAAGIMLVTALVERKWGYTPERERELEKRMDRIEEGNALKLTKGHSVSKPELLHEGYMYAGDTSMIANVHADKIKDVLQHFITMHEEPLFFILELPVNMNRENEIAPGVVRETHKDVYYIDGCSQEKCFELLERYGELLIHDGISSFGFGCHESQDEIMAGSYNILTIYSQHLERYADFYEVHKIGREDDLVTAWDTFTQDAPGQSTRYEYNGMLVFDLPEELKEWNIYLAETREGDV